jgi:hypothetical protein
MRIRQFEPLGSCPPLLDDALAERRGNLSKLSQARNALQPVRADPPPGADEAAMPQGQIPGSQRCRSRCSASPYVIHAYQATAQATPARSLRVALRSGVWDHGSGSGTCSGFTIAGRGQRKSRLTGPVSGWGRSTGSGGGSPCADPACGRERWWGCLDRCAVGGQTPRLVNASRRRDG